MSSDFNILAEAGDDDSLDNHRNAPRPDPASIADSATTICEVTTAASSASSERRDAALAASSAAATISLRSR